MWSNLHFIIVRFHRAATDINFVADILRDLFAPGATVQPSSKQAARNPITLQINPFYRTHPLYGPLKD